METSDNKNKYTKGIQPTGNTEKEKAQKSPIPNDLIDDLKKNKIDTLTEGKTNLGYEERAPRKKELEQKEHLDQDDK